jgi:hypothetical protein
MDAGAATHERQVPVEWEQGGVDPPGIGDQGADILRPRLQTYTDVNAVVTLSGSLHLRHARLAHLEDDAMNHVARPAGVKRIALSRPVPGIRAPPVEPEAVSDQGGRSKQAATRSHRPYQGVHIGTVGEIMGKLRHLGEYAQPAKRKRSMFTGMTRAASTVWLTR